MTGAKPTLDELAHHGVKGMKWGVRKDTSSEGSSSGHSLSEKLTGKTLTDTQKKALVGATIPAGVAVTGLVLHQYGGATITTAQKQAALNTAQALGKRRDELSKSISDSSKSNLLDLPSTKAVIEEHGKISAKYLAAPYATKSQTRYLRKTRNI